MDDDNATSNESDTETCMVVEIQENELGEIMLVERPREETFNDNRFCVVDCKIETSEEEVGESSVFTPEDIQENIEIVYLPDYSDSNNGPIILKQEMLLHDGDFEDPGYEIVESEESYLPARPATSPKVYRRGKKRTFSQSEAGSKTSTNGVVSSQNTALCRETRLRSNPNILLKHQGVFNPRDRSWSLKLDSKDFVPTKSISSVTTIHTNPKSSRRMHSLEDETIPESRLVVENIASRSLNNMLPHKCKYCDQAFRQSVSLQIHSTLHSQSIPDGCHVS